MVARKRAMETNMVAGVRVLIGALVLALPLPAFAHINAGACWVATADGSEHRIVEVASVQQAPTLTVDRQSGIAKTNVLMARAGRASKRHS